QAGHAGQWPVGEAMNAHHVDAVADGAVFRNPVIERAEPYGPAQLLAVTDVAGDPVSMAQQRLRAVEIASGKGLTQFRTRDAAAGVPARRRYPLEAVKAAHAAQRFEVAAAAVSIAEVFTDEQPAGVQARYEQPFDELFRRHAGEAPIEAGEHDLLHAVPVQPV